MIFSKKFILCICIVLLIYFVVYSDNKVKAESLFYMGASQSYYSEPRSLYGSVRARSIGDLITIVMEESISISDTLNYTSSRDSNTVDNFTGLINKVLPGKILNDKFNNFGGSNTVSSDSNTSRQMNYKDSVAVQVVQVMPNGNMLVQGKKTVMNANERIDLIVSGIVDPRWINNTGKISSKNVANLQFAMSGKGAVSRAANDGIINRVIKHLF